MPSIIVASAIQQFATICSLATSPPYYIADGDVYYDVDNNEIGIYKNYEYTMFSTITSDLANYLDTTPTDNPTFNYMYYNETNNSLMVYDSINDLYVEFTELSSDLSEYSYVVAKEGPHPGNCYYDLDEDQLKIFDGNINNWVAFNTMTQSTEGMLILVRKDTEMYNNPQEGYVYIDENNKFRIYYNDEWIVIGSLTLDYLNMVINEQHTLYQDQLDAFTLYNIIQEDYKYSVQLLCDPNTIPFFYERKVLDGGIIELTSLDIDHRFENNGGIDYLYVTFDEDLFPENLYIRFVPANRKLEKCYLVDSESITEIQNENEFIYKGSQTNSRLYKTTITNLTLAELTNSIIELELASEDFDFSLIDSDGTGFAIFSDESCTTELSFNFDIFDYSNEYMKLAISVASLPIDATDIFIKTGVDKTASDIIYVQLSDSLSITQSGTDQSISTTLPYKTDLKIKFTYGSDSEISTNDKIYINDVELAELSYDNETKFIEITVDDIGTYSLYIDNEFITSQMINITGDVSLVLTNVGSETPDNLITGPISIRPLTDDTLYSSQVQKLMFITNDTTLTIGKYILKSTIVLTEWDVEVDALSLILKNSSDEDTALQTKTSMVIGDNSIYTYFDITVEDIYNVKYTSNKDFTISSSYLWRISDEFYTTMR